MPEPAEIVVSNSTIFTMGSGYYAYVGSALGNLETRIARHLSRDKKCHWHIDYLLQYTEMRMALFAETVKKEECSIAQELFKRLSSIPGFGCTDCHCSSHLYFSQDLDHLNRCIISAFKDRKLPSLKTLSALSGN